MKQRMLSDFFRITGELLDITLTQQEKAIWRYEHLGNWLIHQQEGLVAPEVYPQGSFRLGTVVRPLDATGEFDIDLVFLRHLKHTSITQEQLKADTGKLLTRYCKEFDLDPPVELGRCWRLDFFDEGFHMDVLPVIPHEAVDNGIRLSDRELRHWLYSNPIGYADWFYDQMNQDDLRRRREAFAAELGRTAEDVPRFWVRTPLQRVVQLLKRSRDAYFLERPDDQPPSILITTLAAIAYTGQTDVEQAFAEVAATIAMPEAIERRDGRWWVANPAHDSENFADKWNTNPERRDAFYEWLTSVVHANQHAARTYAAEQVGDIFTPVLGTVAERASESMLSTRPSGRQHAATGEGRAPGERFIEEMFPVNITGTVSVALEIQDHRDKSRYHRRQAVKRRKLAKQEQLRFTITGTNVQSPFDVYWKVRNFGPEAAASKGGLRGTIEPDKGSHEKSESTLYRGSHYAECYIIKDGVCVAKKKTWVPIR
jgi:hypothetical protein